MGDDVSTETYATSGSTSTGSTTSRRIRPGSVPRQPSGALTWSTGATAPAEPAKINVPAPRLRQLIGVCGWAAVLGGVGLVVGVRGFFGILAGNPAPWYEPALAAFGVVGIGFTVAGYLTVHRRRSPWIALGAASLVLVGAMIATSVAF
jgi:hypothetical protein